MLFTRCPACQTTFRLTADALGRAEGRVRCGRCGSVFNAAESLLDQPPPQAPLEEPGLQTREPAVEPEPAPLEEEPPHGAIENTDQTPAQRAPEQAQLEDTDPGLTFDLPEDQWSRFFAEVQAESERASQAARLEPVDDEPQTTEPETADEQRRSEEEITLREPGEFFDEAHQAREEAPEGERTPEDDGPPHDEPVDSGTDSHREPAAEGHASPAEETVAPFSGGPSSEIERSESPPSHHSAPRQRWGAGSLALMVMLCLQGIHHFRTGLAGAPVVGAWVRSGYGLIGMDVSPRWDIDQYQIMDWVAAAGAVTDGQDSLRITARIHNGGPRPQPYPHVHLRLKDRWEAAVGSRIFRPAEYMSKVNAGELMAPGVTVPASLVVVDPGQDAYGFELDVCVEVQDNLLSCAADRVFQ